jgi:predicted 2-oxoglutarate/Fe(II)-dependent dioxygenase YbiX
MSHYLEIVFPSAHKEMVGHGLPDGLYPLAGAFIGCVVNIHDSKSPVETKIHRDVKERPFILSCLCLVGDFTGGNLILWELRAVVELKAGDLFFFPDSRIHHSNKAITGIRHSVVAFTQQNMFDYWSKVEGLKDIKMKDLKRRQKRVCTVSLKQAVSP